MFVPHQGFRHAAALLLNGSLRAIPSGAAPEAAADALGRLAEDLVGLADDMRVSPEARAWLIDEYARAIDRLPHSFDAAAVKSKAADIFARVGARARGVERRDLFLIHVSEDRLPIAAPLAVELAKRRVSVALSEYEVTTPDQLAVAVDHGLTHHGAGVVLATGAFERARLHGRLQEGDRLRVLGSPQAPSTAGDLADWVRTLKIGR